LLLQIRYLENDGDATAKSSVEEENTALTEIQNRLNQSSFLYRSSHITNPKTALVSYFINILAQQDGKKDD